MRNRWVVIVAIVLWAAVARGEVAPAAGPPAKIRSLGDMPRALREARYRFLPLPIVATDPAEGNTYGALPVLVALDANDDVLSVLATAYTFNDVIRSGGFAQWILTPSPWEELRLFGGASQRFYREASVDYVNRRLLNHDVTLEGHFLYLEDPFERFFGFGPNTEEAAESNFTSLLLRGTAEARYEFRPHAFVLGQMEWTRVRLQPRAIDRLADTMATYGADPQIGPSHQLTYRAGVRWDSRDGEFFPTHGVMGSAAGLVSHAVQGEDATFGGYELQGKFAWQPTPRVTTVGHLQWRQLFGSRIPLYHQSQLGGERTLRGYVTRRFVDRGAVSLDLEGRILVKEWRLLGTNVALSVDPFAGIGQVFHRLRDWENPRLEPTAGVGFRMRASPSMLGRVDVAYSRDGLAIYTTLDYPF